MLRFPLYDTRFPEDLPESMRLIYGLFGKALAQLPEPLAISATEMQEIIGGRGSKFTAKEHPSGDMVFRSGEYQPLNCDNRDHD